MCFKLKLNNFLNIIVQNKQKNQALELKKYYINVSKMLCCFIEEALFFQLHSEY